jgi:hypothetical protein
VIQNQFLDFQLLGVLFHISRVGKTLLAWSPGSLMGKTRRKEEKHTKKISVQPLISVKS